jgi:hypothetical protein
MIEDGAKVGGKPPEGCDMKKLAVIIGSIVGAVLVAILVAKKNESSVSPEEREAKKAEKRREMFEKMQAGMESMPEGFPPVVMFNNVAATRDNSERILELLGGNGNKAEEPAAAAAK